MQTANEITKFPLIKVVGSIKQYYLRIAPSIRYALGLFLLTRALLVIIALISLYNVPDLSQFPNKASINFVEDLPQAFWWLKVLGHYDASAYVAIATNGYGAARSDLWPFFPVYPFLIGALTSLGIPAFIAGIVVSNIALLISAILIYKIVAMDDDQATAYRSVKYLFLYPTSFLFSSVLSESVYLCLLLATWYFAKQKRFWLAGIVGYSLAATRAIGVFVLFPILYAYFQSISFRWLKFDRNIIFLLFTPLGLFTFMAYNWLKTNDWLRFAHATFEYWPSHHWQNPLLTLWYNLLAGQRLDALIPTLILIALAVFRKKFSIPEIILCLYSIFIPLSTGIDSMARYASIIFPVFILTAKLTSKPIIDQNITIAFAMLQTVLAAFWFIGGSLIM